MEKVLMDAREIACYNARLTEELGTGARLCALEKLEEQIPGDMLMEWVGTDFTLPEGELWTDGGAASTEMLRTMVENCALRRLPPRCPVRWGNCVRRSSFRALPTDMSLRRARDDRYEDLLQESAVPLGEPLAVFHTSADGRFCFAASCFDRGWVAVEDVALWRDREAWRAAQTGEFLTVLESRMRLCAEPDEPRVSSIFLTMGTRLRLAAPVGTVRAVRGRMSCDAYIAALPVRAGDGTAQLCEALVPISADLCVGALPYTRENLLAQAGKMRGEVYGWGGGLDSRDCSSLVMELFRCFGFRLPRNAADLARLPDAQKVGAWSDAEKCALLRTLGAGALLYFPRHVMLYLGWREGKAWCLSAAGNFLPAGSAGGTARRVNTACVCPLDVVRADGRTWLASLTHVIRVKTGERG